MSIANPWGIPADQAAYQEAMKASFQEIVSLLQRVLSRRLTAYIAGVKEGKTVTRWANGEVSEARDSEKTTRLRTAYQITLLLLSHDSPETVRAWFMGLNPQLGDVSPAEAIREGKLKDAIAAARAFSVGG